MNFPDKVPTIDRMKVTFFYCNQSSVGQEQSKGHTLDQNVVGMFHIKPVPILE